MILSAGITLLLMFRLDKLVFPAGFEFLDSGEFTYSLCASLCIA